MVDGTRERLARAVNNLLDNAARHSPPGGPVEVSVGPGGVRVRDHGTGIDPGDLPHLFDRFYRGASARGRPGSGLGLAIVRQVAEQHGGSVSASNAPGRRRRVRARAPGDGSRHARGAPGGLSVDPLGSAPMSSGIEVEGLVREFKKGPRAVDGIELQVQPGEIYGFLGPNGAGKSTTVLMLTTLLPPTAGTARVAGHDILREGPAVRRSIGAALQEAALDPLLTGNDHMRLQTTLQGVAKAERRARGNELMERVGLTDAANRKVGGYSGGMKRRLDLALALVHRPQVLFLDEPTTGLDPSSRADLWAEVSRLAREDGVTVFLTTQYLEEADVLADRVGIIDAGKIVAEGTPEALKAEIGRPSVEAVPAHREDRDAVAAVLSKFGSVVPAPPGAAAVRLESGQDLVAVVRALDSADVQIADIQLHQPSLDDVFLTKTGRKLAPEAVSQA